MNARFVTWTIVAMCLIGLAGCGSDLPSIPLAPTPSTPPPVPTPPPAPPRSLAVDLTGNYTLTFEVGNACEEVPKELRIRTYEATIEYKSSFESIDNFLAELSGATFRDQRPIWVEAIHRASGVSVWLDLALSDNVILEEPEPGTYFMIGGWEGAAYVDPTKRSTISASFIGYFKYCAGTQNQCSFDAMLYNMCKSENSRWTLTRR